MTPVELRALRQRLGLTQTAFAARYCLPRRTVESWEAGRGVSPSAALLLTLIDREPEGIAKILARQTPRIEPDPALRGDLQIRRPRGRPALKREG